MNESKADVIETKGSEGQTGEELIKEGEEDKYLFQETGLFIQEGTNISNTLIEMSQNILEDIESKKDVSHEERKKIYEREQAYKTETEDLVKNFKESSLTDKVLNISQKYPDTQKLRKGIFNVLKIFEEIGQEEDTQRRAQTIMDNLKNNLEPALKFVNEQRTYVFGYGRQKIEKGNTILKEWYKTHKERKIPQSEINELGKVVGPEGVKEMEEYNRL